MNQISKTKYRHQYRNSLLKFQRKMKSTLIGFDTTTNCMHIAVVTSTQVHLGLGALGVFPYYTKCIVHRYSA